MKDFSTMIAMIMAIITFVFQVMCVCFLIWAVVSLVDISIHNLTVNYIYSEWNMFEVFLHINK